MAPPLATRTYDAGVASASKVKRAPRTASDRQRHLEAIGATLFDDVRPDSVHRLLLAAAESFSAKGYSATTTRDISRAAGMSPAALYVHYPSKAHLLGEIILTAHRDVVRAFDEALAGADAPQERLDRLVRIFVEWHARHHVLALVGQRDLNNLLPEDFARMRVLRTRIEQAFEQEIARGVETGAFAVPDVHAVTLAVLSLALDLARWYDPRRHLDPVALADLYAGLVRRMVAA